MPMNVRGVEETTSSSASRRPRSPSPSATTNRMNAVPFMLSRVSLSPPRASSPPVEFVALAVRIANQVEPMTRPALPVVRRGEQLVDQLRPGIGRGVFEERVHFGRRGRQPEKIQVGAADQRALIGARRVLQTLLRH